MNNGRLERATGRQWFVVGLFIILLFSLTSTAVIKISELKSDAKSPQVPPVVSRFLGTYLTPGYEDYAVDGNIFYEVFSELDGLVSIGEPGQSEVEDAFFSVFHFMSDDSVEWDYEVEVVADGFVIIRLYDKMDGSYMPPPIGFWYDVDRDGTKITKWNLARLLPFSKDSEDYSEAWHEIIK